jgi:hypothetical protein
LIGPSQKAPDLGGSNAEATPKQAEGKIWTDCRAPEALASKKTPMISYPRSTGSWLMMRIERVS